MRCTFGVLMCLLMFEVSVKSVRGWSWNLGTILWAGINSCMSLMLSSRVLWSFLLSVTLRLPWEIFARACVVVMTLSPGLSWKTTSPTMPLLPEWTAGSPLLSARLTVPQTPSSLPANGLWKCWTCCIANGGLAPIMKWTDPLYTQKLPLQMVAKTDFSALFTCSFLSVSALKSPKITCSAHCLLNSDLNCCTQWGFAFIFWVFPKTGAR